MIGTSDKGSVNYRTPTYAGPLVLLMGSEREGLSPEQQAVCDTMVHIPMVGRSDSLNLAVATGVVLYEILYKKTVRYITERERFRGTSIHSLIQRCEDVIRATRWQRLVR